MTISATYSPEDNKIRLYCSGRFDSDTFAAARAAGFIWAPKQECLVAPAWTPEREDFARSLLEPGDEIDAEETSAAERAEARSERFENYAQSRARDAEHANQAAHSLAKRIPLGQPILVGHHSERHARRDQKRIEAASRRAHENWQTARYWEVRARDLLRHAERMDRKDVRARRIAKLEAEERKHVRELATLDFSLKGWGRLVQPDGMEGLSMVNRATGEKRPMQELDLVCYLSNGESYFDWPMKDWPRRRPEASRYEGARSIADVVKEGTLTPWEAAVFCIGKNWTRAETCIRWIEHTRHRIAYERAVLEAQGGRTVPTAAEKRATRPAPPPLLNIDAESVMLHGRYGNADAPLPVLKMTAAEWSKIPDDYKSTRTTPEGFRVRSAMRSSSLWVVFLTDKKAHPFPAKAAA